MFARAPYIGAIADDLTGATDLALTLSRGGMRVRQVVGVPQDAAALLGIDAVVVSLKSRTIATAEAVAQSRAAAAALLAAGATQLLFKYCSTFDSTNEGNIGPVIEALLYLLGEKRTVACPAFPANKRTVYKGHLFVGDQLLSDSPMKDHPLTPMRDANLVRLLSQQTRLPVSLIDLTMVRSGADALRAAFDKIDGVAVVDAVDDDDLRAIGAAAKDMRLITGGSGIALGLPSNFPILSGTDKIAQTAPTGREVVLAGSCSTTTRRQIKAALAAGYAGYQLNPLDISSGRQSVDTAVHFASKAATTPIIYASAAPEAVAQSQAALGRDRAGALVENFLAALAPRLVREGFSRIIVAGGESSGAVIDGLGVSSLEIGPEIDPGVPWTLAKGAGSSLALALKSGNFGADDMLLKAWGRLG